MKRSAYLFISVLLLLVLLFAACDEGAMLLPSNSAQETTDVITDEETIESETEPHMHAFGDWTTVKEATCAEQGEQQRMCNCGEIEKQDVPTLEHDLSHYDAKEVTLNSVGWDEYVACDNCDYSTKHETYQIMINQPLTTAKTFMDNSHVYKTLCGNVCLYGLRVKYYDDGICSLQGGRGLYVMNASPLEGLRSITVKFNNNSAYIRSASTIDELLSMNHYSKKDYVELQSGVPYYFDENQAYFIIVPTFDSDIFWESDMQDLNIESIEIQFSPSEYEFGYAYTACDDFAYSMTGTDTCEITGYYGSSTEVVIPPCLNIGEKKLYVTSIHQNAFADFESIAKLVIPGTVKNITPLYINNYTRGCTVVLQEGVENIKDYAFAFTGPVVLFVPDSVEYVGTDALGTACVFFTENLPQNMPENALVSLGQAMCLYSETSKIDYTEMYYGQHIYQYGYDKTPYLVLSNMEEQKEIFAKSVIDYANDVYSGVHVDWESKMRIVADENEYAAFLQLSDSLAQSAQNDEELVRAIFNYVVDHIAYDSEYLYATAYESLMQGKGVCSQYALIFVQLLRCANIPALYVTGYMDTGADSFAQYQANDADWGHAWAIVYYNDSWHWMDPTWGLDWFDFDPELGHIAQEVEGVVNIIDGMDYSHIESMVRVDNSLMYLNALTFYCLDDDLEYFNGDYSIRYGTFRHYYFDNPEHIAGTFCINGWVYDQSDREKKLYYCYIDGRLLCNITTQIDGVWYSFDEFGRLILQ